MFNDESNTNQKVMVDINYNPEKVVEYLHQISLKYDTIVINENYGFVRVEVLIGKYRNLIRDLNSYCSTEDIKSNLVTH